MFRLASANAKAVMQALGDERAPFTRRLGSIASEPAPSQRHHAVDPRPCPS